MTVIAYTLNVPRDIGSRVTREQLLSRVNEAFRGPNASQRFTLQCADAETRLRENILGSRIVLLITMSVARNAPGALTAEDFVMLDSIAFGAMKSASGQGWSVMEIRRRLAPVGSSEAGVASVFYNAATGGPSGVSRTVRDGSNCNLAATPGRRLARERVLNGTNAGAIREPERILPNPDESVIPLEYKVAAGVVGVAVVSIAAAYVWRSFK